MDDVLIIGAGPAGCSAASWASQLGLVVRVLERASAPCATLAGLDFRQSWVLGHPHTPLAELARGYAAHALALQPVDWHFNNAATGLALGAEGHWRVHSADGRLFAARTLLLATGLRPVQPPAYFGASPARLPMDALSLTHRRGALAPGRTLLLGGGDNALENALWLAQRGHAVTLWSRGPWRARPALAAPVRSHAGIHQRQAPLPEKIGDEAGRWAVQVAGRPVEHYEHVAVLFGFEALAEPWQWLSQALGRPLAAGTPCPAQGVFVAGDTSARLHPCVQSALADGLVAAQQVLQHLNGRPASP